MYDFEAKKAGLEPIKLTRDNGARPARYKSNTDKQGYQMPVLYKTKKCLPFYTNHNWRGVYIAIDPIDTVKPDQGIKPMSKYVVKMSWPAWRCQCVSETIASVYTPSGKLCGSIAMHCLCILYSDFRHTQTHQHKQYGHFGHPDFPIALAVARCMNTHTKKPADGSKGSKLANQCTTPDKCIQAFSNGFRVNGRQLNDFPCPPNCNLQVKCYISIYAEVAEFGGNFDAYSVKWIGASLYK